MKKFSILLLVVVGVILLTSCGKNESIPQPESTIEANQEENNKDIETKEENKMLFDESKYTSEKDEPYYYKNDPGRYSESCTYKLKEDYSKVLPDNVLLESTDITLGTDKISKLVDDGWQLINGNKADTTMKARLRSDTVIKNSSDRHAVVYAGNYTEEPKAFSDCEITDVNIKFNDEAVYYDGKTQAAEFNYNGVTPSSSIEDIIKIMSEPKIIFVTDYVYNDECYKSIITLVFYALDENSDEIEIRFEFEDDKSSIEMTSFKIYQQK